MHIYTTKGKGIKMVKLDEIDKNILNIIQLDFPLETHPFEKLGEQLGIPENEMIERLGRLNNAGAIRRIGPIINTKKTGGISTLVAAKVPEQRIDEVAEAINRYPEVSHNYLRPAKYNIWFTISASSEARLIQILDELKAETGCDLINLPTKRLFKIGVKFNIR